MKNLAEIKKKLIERDGLRCAVTGEQVTNPNELSIEHIQPRSKGGSDDIDNLILVKREVNVVIADDERRRTRMLLQELKERQEELAKREQSSFERERSYRQQLEAQQLELEEARLRLQTELTDREATLQRELEKQRALLREQQSRFEAQYSASERMLSEKVMALEGERRKLASELEEREQLLQMSLVDLEKEKQRYTEESRKKIERNSAAYVNEALAALDAAAQTYYRISRNWSILGLVALASGVACAVYIGLLGFGANNAPPSLDWAHVIFFAFKGLVVIGLFVAIAKYCFSYSQSFMHESLKNSERKHAINFGKFYLESYGANAEWAQVREAFEHWNIAPASAFSKNDSEKFDPKTIERAAKLIDSLGKINLARAPAAADGRKSDGVAP